MKLSRVQITHPLIIQTDNCIMNQVHLFADHVEPWTILAHKKPQAGWVPYNPRTMRPPPLSRDIKSMKFLSWNVNGLRALLKLKTFSALQLAQRENFDVLCLQETKLQARRTRLLHFSVCLSFEKLPFCQTST